MSPVFPSDPQEPSPTNTGLYILAGCAGCFCVGLCVLLFLFLGVIEEIIDQPPSLRFPDGSEAVLGSVLPLYGKTLDNKDFDWENLRGKYVLVTFTATWCGPCKMQIPAMLEAYKKYHGRGFEIVSVYIWEDGPNAVATVRRSVEQEKLPWIILSESLTAEAGLPPQGDAFGIEGVPTMVFVDKDGKMIAFGTNYKQELRKVFGK